MRLLRLFSLASAIALSVAQNSSFASCSSDPQYNWMFNSLHQDPCTVAEFVGGACNNGVFRVPPLNSTQEYIGPTAATANECRCSTVFYALLSACAVCQNAQTTTWSFYDGNCSTSYSSVFTKPIPPGTAVPHWAYMNVTAYDGFVVSVAQSLSDSPESTASSATSTSTLTSSSSVSPSPTSSSKSSNAGPIAGGVVGGVFAIALVVIIVLLIRRRKPAPNQANLAGQQQSLMTTGDKDYQQYPLPMQKPLLYDPTDPRTFPASPPPIPVQTTAGSNLNPAITGSSFSSAPTAHGGAYFPGVAEV
ncbi:hypothetical protein JOM56_003413 [Amanita muscaria]